MDDNGDWLLTIGAIVLFAILSLNINSNILLSTNSTIHAEYLNTAVDLSESLIMEIVSKSFDENTINATPDISGLSSNLGTEGETYPNYDDIDDYNSYQIVIQTKYSGSFTSTVRVRYVNTDDFSPSLVQTGMKEITVYTSSPSLTDTVKINYYSSY